MTKEKRSRAVFEAAVEEYVAPFLSEIGFRRQKRTFFYKWNGNCFWRIWPFLRETRGVDEAFLHMTVCIGFRELSELFARWERESQKQKVLQPCNMTADIIYLRPFVQEPLRITPTSSLDRLGISMLHDLKSFILPFLDEVGTFEKAFAIWGKGRFYNAAGSATYLLAAGYFLRGDKLRALEVIRKKRMQEEEQVAAGRSPLGTLSSAEMDLVSTLDLRFDVMANQSLARLKSFEAFLQDEPLPAIPLR